MASTSSCRTSRTARSRRAAAWLGAVALLALPAIGGTPAHAAGSRVPADTADLGAIPYLVEAPAARGRVVLNLSVRFGTEQAAQSYRSGIGALRLRDAAHGVLRDLSVRDDADADIAVEEIQQRLLTAFAPLAPGAESVTVEVLGRASVPRE